MYYAKARFYDPAAKRFVSMDPVKGNVLEPLTLVSYIYCIDNPLKYVDPLGLNPLQDLLKIDFLANNNIGLHRYENQAGEIENYYSVRDVFTQLAGGNLPYEPYNKRINSSRFTVSDEVGKLTLTYSMGGIKGAWFKEVEFNGAVNLGAYGFNAGSFEVPLLYYKQKVYIKRDDIISYFQMVWCEDEKNAPTNLDKKNPVATPTPTPAPEVGSITSQQLHDLGWINADESFAKRLNDSMQLYGITDKNSIALFIATMSAESEYGIYTAEIGNEAYFNKGGYTTNTRGAGYIQITGASTHRSFLDSVGDHYSGSNTAQYIADNYAIEASTWYWGNMPKAGTLTMNEYVEQWGGSPEVFLITQYFVNGYMPSEVYPYFDSDLRSIRLGAEYSTANDILSVSGRTYPLPVGWSKRISAYENAMKVL